MPLKTEDPTDLKTTEVERGGRSHELPRELKEKTLKF